MWTTPTLEGMLPLSTSKIEEGPPAPYHHGDLRRALLAAGGRLLEQRGPRQVSLREVARVAGVSHNAPYRHFDSREALLAALAAEGFEALGAQMERATEGKEGFERLRALGVTYIAFARARPAVYLLMFGPELKMDGFPELKTVAERSFKALQHAIDTVAPEPVASRRRDWRLGARPRAFASHRRQPASARFGGGRQARRAHRRCAWRFTGRVWSHRRIGNNLFGLCLIVRRKQFPHGAEFADELT